MELNEFFDKLIESYSLNHQMTQIIESEEGNDKHTKWMLKEMEFHNSNLEKFQNNYSNTSGYTQNKFHYDFYLFMMGEIKRVRDQSVEFMSSSEKEKHSESVYKFDLNFSREINEVLNTIKNPETHIPVDKPKKGCLLLFVLPPIVYILTLIF
jgi:hypothetical protein